MNKYSRIYIEITNVCNLSCSFCVGNVRAPRFMNETEFLHIINQIKPYTDHIYLHVLGEPLLHPQLDNFLTVAHEFGLKVNITTNGTLLAKRQELLLHKSALRKVSISLHSMEPDSSYCKEEYLRDVASFVSAATNREIICELRMWNLGANENDNKAMITSLCNLLGLNNDSQELALIDICKSGNTMLAPRLYLGKTSRFTWPSMTEPPTNRAIFCYGLRNQLAILSDGTVVPCCLDSKGDIALGNIFQTPLAEIICNDRAKSLYNGFSTRQPTEDLCRRCGYAKRF